MANPTWFDAAHYKAQKLVQLQATDSNGAWTAAKLDSVLTGAGFGGAEGAYAHFTAYGAAEHCSPNATFNAAEYLAAKLVQLQATDKLWVGKSLTDVQAALKASGLGEWEHYKLYGSNEGVNPSNAFSESAYLTAKLAHLVATDPTNWAGKTEANVKAVFAANGISSLEHYNLYGKGEGLVITPVADDAKVTVPAGFNVFGTGAPTGTDFTIGTDHLVGTAGNDTFTAAANAPYGIGVTWTGGDSVDGGAGEDTIILYNQGDILRGAQSVKNVENLNVYTQNDAAYRADVTEFVGLKNVSVTAANQDATLIASTSVTNVTTQGVNGLNITGDGIASVYMANAATTAAAALTITNNTADHALAFGAETVGELDKDGIATANVLTVTDAHAKSIAITSKGLGNNLAFGDNAALVDVTIEGDAKLALAMNGAADQADKVVSIDGSKATGDLRLDGLANATATIKTGAGDDSFSTGAVEGKLTIDTASGDDTVTVATGAVLAAESTISLGDGDDELIMNFADLSKNVVLDGGAGSGDTLTFDTDANFTANAAKYAMVKDHGFEIVGITDPAAGGTTTLTASAARLGVSHFQMDGADAALVLTAVADGTIIDANAAASAGTIAMQDANGELTINLSNDGAAITNGTFDLTNVKTVNLTSEHTGATNALHNQAHMTFDVDNAIVGIKGEKALTYTVETTTLGQKVDASGLDADFTFTGNAVSDTVKGGSGVNIITGGNGVDTINLEASIGNSDTVVLTGIVTSANGDNISGFEAGADKDHIVITGTAATAAVTSTGFAAATKGTLATLVTQTTSSMSIFEYAAADAAFDGLNADAAVAKFFNDYVDTNGIAAGTPGMHGTANGDAGYAIIYSNSDAYIFHVTAAVATAITATEIQLVGKFDGVEAGAFVADNFLFQA